MVFSCKNIFICDFCQLVENTSFCQQNLFVPGEFFSSQWQKHANPGYSITHHQSSCLQATVN